MLSKIVLACTFVLAMAVPALADSSSCSEPIAPAAVDLSAEAPYVDLDDVRFCGKVSIPQGMDQAISAEDLTWVSGEQFEEREFTRREVYRLAASPDPQRGRVEGQVADYNPRGAVFEPAPAQRPDASPELIDAEGLCKVVVGTTIESGDPVLDPIEGGQHQDGPRKTGAPKCGAGREAVEARQDDVEQDEVIVVRLRPFQRFRPGSHDVSSVAVCCKHRFDGVGDVELVFDDQDPQVSSLRLLISADIGPERARACLSLCHST